MKRVGRRKFMAAGLTGIGATSVVTACGNGDKPAAPERSAGATRAAGQLRLIVRGLVAFAIYPTHVDVLLMDERKLSGTHVGHSARVSVEKGSSVNLADGKDTQMDQQGPVRSWGIRGQLVTLGPSQQFRAAAPVRVATSSIGSPWESFTSLLDFRRVHKGPLRSNLDTAADGVVAGILRLAHGSLGGAIPSRRAGNMIAWTVTSTDGTRWLQPLTDTVVYLLDLPDGSLRLDRAELKGYQGEPGVAVPSHESLELRAHGGTILASLDHDVETNDRDHLSDQELAHNEVFYGLFTSPPPKSQQTYPRGEQPWTEEGVVGIARSNIWVPNDPSERNKTDPNCNCVFVRVG